jgi:polysaccharide biosynthesis protein PslG
MTVLAAAGVAGAKRLVPRGTLGVVVDGGLTGAPPSLLDSQMALMAKSGVESVRTDFGWANDEPADGVYNWSSTDEIVAAAARHGIELLPIVEFTPQWASSHPSSAWLFYIPKNVQTYATFMTAIVGRYGPHGSFWKQNPGVPFDPIHDWQLWNEPEGTQYDWRSPPWPSTYTKLLKAGYAGVHRADHTAKVVSGALVGLNTTTLTPWAEAQDLYRVGWKRYFDILAVNAYTGSPSVTDSVNRSIEIVHLVRQVMLRYHDGSKPIWDTEFTWSSALGKIPPIDYIGIENTEKGQAARMTLFYKRIASHPEGLQRGFWYSWYSSYEPVSPFGDPLTFNYSGLVKWDENPAHRLTPEPLLGAYASIAAKLEGCRKATSGKCV